MRHHRTFVLAALSPSRRVLLCQHGALHVHWDHITLHMLSAEFENLAAVVEKGTQHPSLNAVHQGQCCLHLGTEGYFRLLIGNVMLFLTVLDLAQLRNMLKEALRRLHEEAPETDQVPESRSIQVPPIPFSQN